MQHLTLPGPDLAKRQLSAEHQAYLDSWLKSALNHVEAGDVAASTCIQGVFIELLTFGEPRTDWLGVFDAYLTDDDGRPMAYSARFAERLHRFGQQAKQATIHATHSRWWIDRALNDDSHVEHDRYAGLIRAKEKNGWFYDHDVSETIERHRMKSELTMSLAEAVEILAAAGDLHSSAEMLVSSLAAFPQTGYVSAEYFRLRALEVLSGTAHMPSDTASVLPECALPVGYCDFAVGSKVDAYMGTAKRVARDKAVPSPLAACQVATLASVVSDKRAAEEANAHLSEYASHLRKNPLDIPAFQMRDVPIPFGADKTPIEVICASELIASAAEKQ